MTNSPRPARGDRSARASRAPTLARASGGPHGQRHVCEPDCESPRCPARAQIRRQIAYNGSDAMGTPDPPSNVELPACRACGLRTTCNLVRLGIDEEWYLCPFTCFPALLADCRDWLAGELAHNQQLGAAEEGPSPC